MSSWHLYPRYFVIADRSWRGVAFIDDPLNQDGIYVGAHDDERWDAPDYRDPEELDGDPGFGPYDDGVHHEYEPEVEEEGEPLIVGEEWTLLSVKKAARLLYPDDYDEQWKYCDRFADTHQLTAEQRRELKEFVVGVIYA